MRYQILDWDSDFFGIRVGRIIRSQLEVEELSEILSELREMQVKLVYWPSDLEIEVDLAAKLGGFLADKKTTFAMDFHSINFDKNISTDTVESFTTSMSVNDLESLAIQSGEYSRFAIDPNLPKDKFVSLYKIWIDRSARKEIASEVLLIRDCEKFAGMVTLGEKNGRGDIGLIAVDSNYRGRKYGEKLVRAAQRWFSENGYEYGQVVTQGQNVPACNLYIKCGYSVEQVEYFYHFWL
jgi:dTDP-4-amino-4,6-dideoxy-D-galactose acyltransferase